MDLAAKMHIQPIELDGIEALVGQRPAERCFEIIEVTEKSRATGWDIQVYKIIEVSCPSGGETEGGSDGSYPGVPPGDDFGDPFSEGPSGGGGSAPSGPGPNNPQEIDFNDTGIYTAPIIRLNAITQLGELLQLGPYTSPQMQYLINDASVDQVVGLLNFIEKEQRSNEAKEFAIAAIEALEEGGEVDFENRLIFNPLIAQDYQASMSPAEIAIFNTLNPLQKEGYLRAATQAYIYAESHFPRPVRNRKGDTFKHTFWNALSTIYIGEALTEQLTTAHEDIEYIPDYPNHYKETQMDLHNNAQGRQIANGSGRIYQMVHQAMSNGSLRYLNNLEYTGAFWRATNNSQLTPTNQ